MTVGPIGNLRSRDPVPHSQIYARRARLWISARLHDHGVTGVENSGGVAIANRLPRLSQGARVAIVPCGIIHIISRQCWVVVALQGAQVWRNPGEWQPSIYPHIPRGRSTVELVVVRHRIHEVGIGSYVAPQRTIVPGRVVTEGYHVIESQIVPAGELRRIRAPWVDKTPACGIYHNIVLSRDVPRGSRAKSALGARITKEGKARKEQWHSLGCTTFPK